MVSLTTLFRCRPGHARGPIPRPPSDPRNNEDVSRGRYYSFAAAIFISDCRRGLQTIQRSAPAAVISLRDTEIHLHYLHFVNAPVARCWSVSARARARALAGCYSLSHASPPGFHGGRVSVYGSPSSRGN